MTNATDVEAENQAYTNKTTQLPKSTSERKNLLSRDSFKGLTMQANNNQEQSTSALSIPQHHAALSIKQECLSFTNSLLKMVRALTSKSYSALTCLALSTYLLAGCQMTQSNGSAPALKTDERGELFAYVFEDFAPALGHYYALGDSQFALTEASGQEQDVADNNASSSAQSLNGDDGSSYSNATSASSALNPLTDFFKKLTHKGPSRDEVIAESLATSLQRYGASVCRIEGNCAQDAIKLMPAIYEDEDTQSLIVQVSTEDLSFSRLYTYYGESLGPMSLVLTTNIKPLYSRELTAPNAYRAPYVPKQKVAPEQGLNNGILAVNDEPTNSKSKSKSAKANKANNANKANTSSAKANDKSKNLAANKNNHLSANKTNKANAKQQNHASKQLKSQAFTTAYAGRYGSSSIKATSSSTKANAESANLSASSEASNLASTSESANLTSASTASLGAAATVASAALTSTASARSNQASNSTLKANKTTKSPYLNRGLTAHYDAKANVSNTASSTSSPETYTASKGLVPNIDTRAQSSNASKANKAVLNDETVSKAVSKAASKSASQSLKNDEHKVKQAIPDEALKPRLTASLNSSATSDDKAQASKAAVAASTNSPKKASAKKLTRAERRAERLKQRELAQTKKKAVKAAQAAVKEAQKAHQERLAQQSLASSSAGSALNLERALTSAKH